MLFVWRHKVLFSVLLLVAVAIGSGIHYANTILTGLTPAYLSRALGGRVTIDSTTGSLLHGLVLENVKFYPQTPAGIAPAPLFTARELRIGCNLLKSLMLKDRYLTITALEPRVETDLDEVLLDPSMVLALPPLLAARGVMITFEVQGGSARLTSAARAPFEITYNLEGSLTPAGLLTLTAPIQHAMATTTVKATMDLTTRQGSAEASFASSYLARYPIEAAGWSFGTPLEGKAGASIAIVEPTVEPPPGALRVAFGPHLKLDIKAAGTIEGKAGVLECAERHLRVIGVTTAGTFDKDGLKLTDGYLELFGGKVTPSGVLPNYEVPRAQLFLALHGLDASKVPGLETFTSKGRADGSAVIAVNKPMHFALDCTGPSGSWYAFESAHVEGLLDGPLVTIEKVIAHAQGGTGVASGSVDLTAKRLELSANFERFPFSTFKPVLEILDLQDGIYTGTLSGAALLSPFRSEHWTFDFTIDHPSIHEYRGTQARLKGTFADHVLKIPRLEMDREGAWESARFEMEKGPESAFKLRGTVKGLDLSHVTDSWAGRADIGLACGVVNGKLVEAAKGEVRQFGARKSARKVPALSFRISGAHDGGHDLEITDHASYQVTAKLPEVSGTDFSLATLLKRPVTGAFRVQDLAPFAQLLTPGQADLVQGGQVSGTFEARAAGDGMAIATRVDKMALATSHGPVTAEDFGLAWDGRELVIDDLDAKIKGAPVSVDGRIGSSGQANLTVKIADYAVGMPGSPAPRPGARAPAGLHARLSATAHLVGALERPSIEADVALSDMQVAGGVPAGLKGHLVYRDGRAALKGSLSTADMVCPVVGSAPVLLNIKEGTMQEAPGPVDLQVQVPRTDAGLLTMLAPGTIAGATGEARLALKVGGTWEQPRMDGNLDVDARSVKLVSGGTLTDVKAGLVFDRDRIDVKQMSGRTLGGDLTASGTMPLPGGSGKYDMRVELDGVHRKTPFIEVWNMCSSLTVTGDSKQPQVAGKVKFDRGEVHLEHVSDDDSTTLKDFLAGVPLNNPALNVKLDVPGRLQVKSNQMDAEMHGQLVLTDHAQDYHIRGELETLRGTVFLNQRRISVIDGSIKWTRPQREELYTFSPLDDPTASGKGLDSSVDSPYVNIHGQTIVDSVRVYVDAKGFAYNDGVRLSLRSIPDMDQNQIASLLVTGKNNLADPSTREMGALVTNTVGGMAVGSLVDRRVESTVQRAFKLDDFRLNSGLFSLTSANPADRQHPAVSVGKYLTDKVYVAADGLLDNSAPFLQRVELDLKLDKTLKMTVERAMANTGTTGTFFDRTDIQPLSTNEMRLGVTKDFKW